MTRNDSLNGLYVRRDRIVVGEVDDAQRDGLIEAIGAADTSRADDPALETFVVTHYTRLIGLAGLVCGDVSAAEDIVQNALERAWRARASLEAAGRLRPWLDRIVVREAARERRARLTRLTRLVRRPAVTEIDVAVPERELVDRAAGRYPADVEVRAVLAALTPAHRAAIVLHLHAGYSVDETAQILGIPRETVRSRLRVAREQLRRALEEGHP